MSCHDPYCVWQKIRGKEVVIAPSRAKDGWWSVFQVSWGGWKSFVTVLSTAAAALAFARDHGAHVKSIGGVTVVVSNPRVDKSPSGVDRT